MKVWNTCRRKRSRTGKPEGDEQAGDVRASGRVAGGYSRPKLRTVLADPPWQFINRTGKVAPEHRRLSRYNTMTVKEICGLPVAKAVHDTAHLYLWVPNALLPEGLEVLKAWGFAYKSDVIWHKLRKDGGSDGRGVGFYFRNVTEILLFGVRGKNAERSTSAARRSTTSAPARVSTAASPMSNTR